MPPTDAVDGDGVTARVDAVLLTRPDASAHRCAEALNALTRARDTERDPVRRGGLNLLITLVMGVKHPLGKPPWDELADARRMFLTPWGDRNDA